MLLLVTVVWAGDVVGTFTAGVVGCTVGVAGLVMVLFCGVAGAATGVCGVVTGVSCCCGCSAGRGVG